MKKLTHILLAALMVLSIADILYSQDRQRVRELGLSPGILTPGPLNAITDVDGVRVGHHTMNEGESTRTGITAILPHGGNLYRERVPAAVYVGNGFGKALGFTQVRELGELETPLALTNTLNIFNVAHGVADYVLNLEGNENVRSVNPVVGETNDGYLNNIRARVVTSEDVYSAIDAAKSGPVAEGSVGAGTGTRALGFKAGIGTSSRRLPESRGGYTVGVLVQSNFGGILTVDGAPVGEELGNHYMSGDVPYEVNLGAKMNNGFHGQFDQKLFGTGESTSSPDDGYDYDVDGSIMIVVATDAPLTSRNLERLAKRAMLGVARTGGFASNGSGDYVIAFSTHEDLLRDIDSDDDIIERSELANSAMSPLFLATVEATEEAILNSLFMAETMTGHDGSSMDALPLDDVMEILKRYGVVDQ